jgi:hypothetical protein
MAPFHYIGGLFQQATQQASRSTVLRPLGWLATICVVAVLGVIEVRGPAWLTVVLAVFTGLTFASYLGAFVYCLLTDKEALRSETYLIQRSAIEKGFVGDGLAGIFRAEELPAGRLIEGATPLSQTAKEEKN